MADDMSQEQVYRQAEKRVAEKQGFFVHLAVYVAVNILLVIIWAVAAGGGFPWFVFPLAGWGVGLLFHFLGVFVFEGEPNRAAIEREVQRIQKRQG